MPLFGECAEQRRALLQAEECSSTCGCQGLLAGLRPQSVCVKDPPQGGSDPGWHSSGSQVFLQSRYISDPSLDCRNSVRVAGEGSCRYPWKVVTMDVVLNLQGRQGGIVLSIAGKRALHALTADVFLICRAAVGCEVSS